MSDKVADSPFGVRKMSYKFRYELGTLWAPSPVQAPPTSPSNGQSQPSSTAENWDRLAAADAMWTVLSDPSKSGGRWNAEEFFATGSTIAEVINSLEEMGFHIQRAVAIDFGCGVGRVSRWLTMCFSHGIGVDFSSKRLELAEEYNAQTFPITFVQGNETNIPLETSSADFVYSVIALQHIPRPLQELYLREFARVVRPG